MNKNSLTVNIENIGEYIYFIRGHKVILDEDLAMLYGVKTGMLNRAVKRNIDRFPEDFAFQLNKDEWSSLICQFGISKLNSLRFQIGTLDINSLNSQIVTSKGRGGRRKLPYVFTEQGVAMLSSVLKSPQAVKINIEIMRAFVKLRHILSSNEKLSKEMEELKSFILKHTQKNDQEFKRVWDMFKKLMTPPENQRKIGFDLNS